MAKKEKQEETEAVKWQALFDNVWLLFALSLVISIAIYNVWGIIDMMNIPLAK